MPSYLKIRHKTQKNLIFNIFVGIILFVLLPIIILLYINSNNLNLDNRSEAAGKTIFVDPSMNLQEIINNAGDSDAIFLNPGEYSLSRPLNIQDKKIRILGSGETYTIIRPALISNKASIIEILNSNITIQSLTISGSSSDGIRVTGNSKLSLIETVVSGHSKNGILFEGTSLLVQRSIIQENGLGILVYSGDVEIYNSFIRNSANDGILFKTKENNLKVRNSIFENNKQAGIKISGGKDIEIKNTNLVKNGVGVQEESEFSKTQISNSIFQSNSIDGLKLNNNSNISYSSYYQNGSSNIVPQNLNTKEGMIFQDAKFVSNNDYRLSPTSPLKDKGNPNEFDPDGTRIDIGAYGGNNILPSSNNPPVVKSTPNEYVKPNEKYRYEIIAEDSDGDNLVYVAMNTLPNWLKLEKNILEGNPTINDIGYYGVIVVISDMKGGNTVHAININVLPDQVSSSSNPPVTTQTPTSTPNATVTNIPSTPSPTPTIIIPKIQIISPKQDDIFNAENNEIKWQILPESTSIEKIKISYSSDGDNYQQLVELPGSSTSYKWKDIENLVPGKYFIKIQAVDVRNTSLEIAAISPQFEVQIKKSTPSQITITKNSPSDNDVVKDNKIQIIVEFKPEAELDKSQTRLIVEGTEVAYRTTKNTIYYQPVQPYEGSRVKVEVYLVTTEGATASKQWIFNIEEGVNPADTSPDVRVNTQICLPGGICIPQIIGLICIGFIVLILLILIMIFAIRIIKNIRDQRQGNIENEFSDFYGEGGIIEMGKNTSGNVTSTKTNDIHQASTYNTDEYQNSTTSAASNDDYSEYYLNNSNPQIQNYPSDINVNQAGSQIQNTTFNDNLNDGNQLLQNQYSELNTYDQISNTTNNLDQNIQELNGQEDSLSTSQAEFKDLNAQSSQFIGNNVSTEPSTTSTQSYQEPQTFFNTPVFPNTTQSYVDFNNQVNQSNTGISTSQTQAQIPVDQQAFTNDQNSQISQQNNLQYQDSEYLKSLMEKYGIDPKNYSDNLSSTTDSTDKQIPQVSKN